MSLTHQEPPQGEDRWQQVPFICWRWLGAEPVWGLRSNPSPLWGALTTTLVSLSFLIFHISCSDEIHVEILNGDRAPTRCPKLQVETFSRDYKRVADCQLRLLVRRWLGEDRWRREAISITLSCLIWVFSGSRPPFTSWVSFIISMILF